ncbi:S49 family peptidase [Paracoccaceae bacterium]|jgi:serine protease SohB|nr:S49 family peptidase [Paracoccaceae bacterium]
MKLKIPFRKKRALVSVVRLSGVISSGSRGQLNDQSLAPVFEKAFSKGKPDAVALVVNSPGGSPVQSSLIGARIRSLASEKKTPVYAFVEDVAASGGYWLAAAADEIYVDHSSIVGSIGVISAGFGAHEFISRYGIERRVYTAGKSKSTLDPFKPEKPEDIKRLKGLLGDIHQTFADYVSERRGARISENNELFTGEFWVGKKAIELGLADHIGHLEQVMKERFGDKVRYKTYGPKKGWGLRLGASLFDSASAQIEEKVAYAKFGL